jgi:predicted dehydrogenase
MAPGFGLNMSYTVNFERATADYDMSRGEALKLFEAGQEPRVIKCEGPDGFIAELTHIAEAIQGGRTPSVVTAAEAVSAIEICEAEEQSVRTGRVVELS